MSDSPAGRDVPAGGPKVRADTGRAGAGGADTGRAGAGRADTGRAGAGGADTGLGNPGRAGEGLSASTDRLIRRRLAEARQDELLTIYESLLATIWERLEAPLGRTTVRVLMERALGEVVGPHSLLRVVRVTATGPDLRGLTEVLSAESPDFAARLADARDGLREFVIHVVELLAVLTGDTIVRQLLPDLDTASTSPGAAGPAGGESGPAVRGT